MTPRPPALEHAFTIEAEIDAPRPAGLSAAGERLLVPITGGRVFGPRLEGRVLPGGADWPLIENDRVARIRAEYVIEATDGTLIHVENRGIRVAEPAIVARLRAGEAVAPEAFYMRGAPVFEAPPGPHRWLSEHQFLCRIAPAPGRVRVEVFVVR
ncbi:MAG: UPF0311 protein [Paracoccaceae bacterium]|nr:MAG: UPF0311 protein [Paracoccaceae bacterium]